MRNRIRLAVLALCGVTLTALAASPELRYSAFVQLRSVAQPLIAFGETIDPRFDDFYVGMVESLPPQQRAEAAIEHAVNRRRGAAEYVLAEAAGWSDEIEASERLEALLQVAGNSPQMETRLAAIELRLAAYGFRKTAEQVEWVIDGVQQGELEPDWYSYMLAALGARAVERERIYDFLLGAVANPEPARRRWAVDALALFGGTETIEPLLWIAENDPVPQVRERAFCGLASSGTLLLAERYEAVPAILRMVERSDLDAQTRGWAYQALREISSMYDLPEQPAAWRQRLQRVGLLDGPER